VVFAIQAARRFVITSHVAQDGDNVASQLAVALILGRLGKEVRIVDRDPVPPRWRFLPGVDCIEVADRVPGDPEVGIVVDTTRIGRTGLDWSGVRPPLVLVNLDHHVSNERFGDVNWVETDSPATSFLAYRLALRLGVEIEPDLATCLFTGLMTDTGYFHYAGTTAETFRAAAELIAHGARHVDLYRQVYDDRPLPELRLLGHALAEIRTCAGDRVAWIEITPATLSRAGATFEHAGPIVNSLCTIRGVDVGLTFEERGARRTMVEIRSSGRVDVGAIAKALGGGGHHNASGCTLEVGLDAARAVVLEHVSEAVRRSGPLASATSPASPASSTSPALHAAPAG
jgi:phosphoesterase RecJ-like protein